MNGDTTITRYAVSFCPKDNHKTVLYTAIGIGSTPDPQFAHLYTTELLAQKEAKSRAKWYVKVKIVPVEVKWPLFHFLTK